MKKWFEMLVGSLDSRSAATLLWDAISGNLTRQLPVGITAVAARHRVVVPLYRVNGERRLLLSPGDRSLARAFASYNARRAKAFLAVLHDGARRVPGGWLTWKAGALLVSVPGYHAVFEAADVDVLATPDAGRAWLQMLDERGTVTKRRDCPSGDLESFQGEIWVEPEMRLVWDVKVVDELPARQWEGTVPVVADAGHHELLEAHMERHLNDIDGCRVRMFYDARIAGAPWVDERLARWLAPEG